MPPGQQAGSPRLVPSRSAFSVSTSLESLSTRLQRFTLVRFPGSHLTLSQSAFSATFTTPAVVPAQLAAVWNLPLRGGSEGPTLIANAALLRVALSTSDYPPHSWHKSYVATPARWANRCPSIQSCARSRSNSLPK